MALAGGLTPETVGEVVTLVRPDVADVSSGVESLPGIKDHEKIARFLEAVLGRSSTVG
jgi:phosphoribosylanthranilate isomerase